MTKKEMKQYSNAIKAFWEVYDQFGDYNSMVDALVENYELSKDERNFLFDKWDELIDSTRPEVDIQHKFALGDMRTTVTVTYKRLGVEQHSQSIELKGIIDADAVKSLMVMGRNITGWETLDTVIFNKPTDKE